MKQDRIEHNRIVGLHLKATDQLIKVLLRVTLKPNEKFLNILKIYYKVYYHEKQSW